MEALFKAIKGDKLELAIKILAHYGLRRSEVVGLRWQAINFEHDTLTINHKVMKTGKTLYASDILKSQSSYRTFPLIPTIKELLIKRQKEIANKKEYFGNTYNHNGMSMF